MRHLTAAPPAILWWLAATRGGPAIRGAVMIISDDWVGDVLKFWFEESTPEQWFKKDPAFDAAVRRRFLALHEVLADNISEALFVDARTALAAVIVLDQMSRNIFRDTPRAFA